MSDTAPTPIRPEQSPMEAARQLLERSHKEVASRLTRNRAEIALLQAEVREDVALKADLDRALAPFSKTKKTKSTPTPTSAA